MFSLFYLISALWFHDAAVAYQLWFQDPATTTMEGIYLFNLHLLFVIISIIIVVAWLLSSILTNFTGFDRSDVTTFIYSDPVKFNFDKYYKLAETLNDAHDPNKDYGCSILNSCFPQNIICRDGYSYILLINYIIMSLTKKTNNSTLRLRSKTFFVRYQTAKTVRLNSIKKYFFMNFPQPSNTQMRFFIMNISNNTSETNTIIVFLEFNETQEVRNSENRHRLSSNINNETINGNSFSPKNTYLSLAYLLQVYFIARRKKYITNFDDNLITKISNNIIISDVLDHSSVLSGNEKRDQAYLLGSSSIATPSFPPVVAALASPDTSPPTFRINGGGKVHNVKKRGRGRPPESKNKKK